MKAIKYGLIWMGAVALFFLAGCAESQLLRCKYTVGKVERVRYYREFIYRSWVEMPGKGSTKSGMRKTVEELIVRREVESVEPDGSAVIKVTFEKAMMTIDTQNHRTCFAMKAISIIRGPPNPWSRNWQGSPIASGSHPIPPYWRSPAWRSN